MFFRQTWEEVNLDNLDHNLDTIIKALNRKALFAIIKANAYGVGDFQVASRAVAKKAQYLGVSSLDEAISLRHQGITAPILVLNYVSYQHLLAAKKNNITITVVSFEHAQKIKESRINGLRLHFKVDTGMNRIGFKDDQELYDAIIALKQDHDVEGIYTHYLDSSEANQITKEQFDSFKRTIKRIDHPFKYIHLANSDAIFNFNDDISNAARAGIAMFGLASNNKDLKPVCSLYTKIVHIKQVSEKETISYKGTYLTKNNEWIATLPIGYADGLNRHYQDQTVYVNNEYAKIVGRICMDQCMISLKNYQPIDTVVEIFGPHIPIEEVAKRLDTIPYEILTSISDRVARVYRRKRGIEKIDNQRLDNKNDCD